MSILPNDFTGSRWFPNGHLETVLPALFRNVAQSYERERLILSDRDFMDLDWVRTGSNRLLVLLHGLEGSSQSQYIKGFARYFVSHGFDVCAVNFRSCSGEMNLLPRSYHSGATDDLHEVLRYLQTLSVYREISLVGFSLGGNVLLKYFGERGASLFPEIKSGVAFSAPVDLAGCAIRMSEWYNRLYLNRFLRSLKYKMHQKAMQFSDFPDTHEINRIQSFYAFDDDFTAPLHGFRSASHYYESCSSIHFLEAIQRPVLLVNAHNDPFLPPTCYPFQQAEANPDFYLATPAGGGHVGFSENLPNSAYWSEKIAEAFILGKMFH